MVVHGEQRFAYERPLHAGDVVTAQVTISDIKSVGSNRDDDDQAEIATTDGEHVCTAHTSSWSGAAPDERAGHVR